MESTQRAPNTLFLRARCRLSTHSSKEKRRKKAQNTKKKMGGGRNEEGKRRAKRFPGKSIPSPVPTSMAVGRVASGGGSKG